MAALANDRGRRKASAAATDKLRGGPGLVPERSPEDGLDHDVSWRIRNAAMDLVVGARSSVSDEVREYNHPPPTATTSPGSSL